MMIAVTETVIIFYKLDRIQSWGYEEGFYWHIYCRIDLSEEAEGQMLNTMETTTHRQNWKLCTRDERGGMYSCASTNKCWGSSGHCLLSIHGGHLTRSNLVAQNAHYCYNPPRHDHHHRQYRVQMTKLAVWLNYIFHTLKIYTWDAPPSITVKEFHWRIFFQTKTNHQLYGL